LKAGSFSLGVCYCPQTISENAVASANFIDYLESTFDIISNMHLCGTILMGDFNAKDIRWGFMNINNPLGIRIYNCVAESNLNQVMNEPTRITATSKLDLVFTDSPNLIKLKGLPPLPRCDHSIICVVMSTKIKNNCSYFRECFDSKHTNWDNINKEPLAVVWDWDYCYIGDPVAVAENWLKLFHDTLRQCIPIKLC
jgi:hypothetical protein